MSDLIDEACLLADIEVFEQPRDQFDAAAKTAPVGGSILVLNLGFYHLDAAYGSWDDREKAYRRESSMGLQDLGMRWLSKQLTLRVLIAYNTNANLSQEEQRWPIAMGLHDISMEVTKARDRIKFGMD